MTHTESTLCPICHARTSTPATLPDGSVVCQLCGENASVAARALASTFGPEWDALTDSDRALIVRDCITPDDAIAEFGSYAEYRRNIGPGNLGAYALTQRARFRRVDSRHD